MKFGPIERFTIVAESDIEISSVPDAPRPLRIARGGKLEFVSADVLYVKAARDGQKESRDG